MIARTNVHRRSRAKQKKPYIPRSHDTLLSIGAVAANAVIFTANERLTFANDGAGNLLVPAYTVNAVLPTGIDNVTATSFRLTWAAAVATDDLIIPAQDPAVRNYTGGYMTQQVTVLA